MKHTPLTVVTATTSPDRAQGCVQSWRDLATGDYKLIVVYNGFAGYPYMGTVPAFRRGVEDALTGGADIIACLHDDLIIQERGWDDKVLEHFRRHPKCGLAGFGGAIGLGSEDIYQRPYDPLQLARVGFRSNLVDAEAHGLRSTLPERVACLDGFSQIGRREFWLGEPPKIQHAVEREQLLPLLQQIEEQGIIHHMYDGALGALAARNGWECWYIPLACQHLGGRTAVGDPGYQAWANQQILGGDHGFWQQSHRHAYEWLRDVLPLRV